MIVLSPVLQGEDLLISYAKLYEGELRRRFNAKFIPHGFIIEQMKCLDLLYSKEDKNRLATLATASETISDFFRFV